MAKDMDQKFYVILIVAVLSLGFSAAAENAAEVPMVRSYRTKKGDSLKSVAKKFFPTHGKKYGETVEDFIQGIKDLNPQIKNWDKLAKKTTIYLDKLKSSRPEVAALPTLPTLPTILSPKEVAPVVPVNETPPVVVKKASKLYALVTLSQGSFSEKLISGSSTLKSTQNSPLSIGFGSHYQFANSSSLLSGSGYWSYLLSSELKGDMAGAPEKVSPPPEVGFNLYFQHLVNNFSVSFYEGVDYESFSTVNTLHFVAGDNLTIYSNTMIFATLGIAKIFDVYSKKMTIKFGFSQSLISKTTGPTADNFTGQRILLFASVSGESRLSYHLLYKKHLLKGPTNLTIDRVGLGVGYDFF